MRTFNSKIFRIFFLALLMLQVVLGQKFLGDWRAFYKDLDGVEPFPNKVYSYEIWTENFYELIIDTTGLSPRHTTILMDRRNVTVYGIYEENFPSKFLYEKFTLPERMFWGTVGAKYVKGWTIIYGWQLKGRVKPPSTVKRLAYQEGDWEPWVNLKPEYLAKKLGTTTTPKPVTFPRFHNEDYYLDEIE